MEELRRNRCPMAILNIKNFPDDLHEAQSVARRAAPHRLRGNLLKRWSRPIQPVGRVHSLW